jgi:outer membrane lipoprotein carrier protein
MKKILFYFIFVLHLSPVFSQATFTPITAQDIANIKTQIKTKNEQIATLSCQFTQTKKMSVLKEPSVSKGNMFYKKSDKFRWDYTKNPKFIFAQNGKTIYTKSNDKVQIVKDNSAKL